MAARLEMVEFCSQGSVRVEGWSKGLEGWPVGRTFATASGCSGESPEGWRKRGNARQGGGGGLVGTRGRRR